MKILFYIEYFKNMGGAENYAISLCKELKKRGHDIHVVCRDGNDIASIKIHRNFNNIKEVWKKVIPDVTFDWGLFERADISRLGGGIHKKFILYGLYTYPHYIRPIKWLLYRIGKHRKKIKQQAYVLSSQSTLYIAPSNFIKKHAVDYGIPENRIVVLYNGVDLVKFCPKNKRFKIDQRRKWGIGEDEVVFLFVSHNLRLKNIRLLKKVFDKLFPKYSMIRLMVVGKRRPNFTAPYLIYTGAIDDMREIYAIGDVLVHPSYFDTFGSVVIEAMASGIPVIVSKFTGASEIVENGGFVLPVVENNVEEIWANTVEKMLNKRFRLELGRTAREIAEKYDFSLYVDKIEEIIRLQAK